MTLVRRFHPEAGRELDAAANWYEDQQIGLGDDFAELVEEAIDLILEWPRIAPIFPGWDREPVVRAQAVSRFPYRVLYYLTDQDVVILAVAHNRRKPGYWTSRIGG
ncbi:MAG: type II toxin-antitoxin system RelE/ParE family toxin [Actinobacteria bacterium]|nr:type II toxin-antitoxin system RelE/ParE family toxin [Actinomycetota bacterium]